MNEKTFNCNQYCFANIDGHCTILTKPVRDIYGDCRFQKTPQKAAADRKAAKKRSEFMMTEGRLKVQEDKVKR